MVVFISFAMLAAIGSRCDTNNHNADPMRVVPGGILAPLFKSTGYRKYKNACGRQHESLSTIRAKHRNTRKDMSREISARLEDVEAILGTPGAVTKCPTWIVSDQRAFETVEYPGNASCTVKAPRKLQ
jgi:hypothetical protein